MSSACLVSFFPHEKLNERPVACTESANHEARPGAVAMASQIMGIDCELNSYSNVIFFFWLVCFSIGFCGYSLIAKKSEIFQKHK